MQNDMVFSFRASDGNTVRLEYNESLSSASALAREYAASGYPDRYVVFTERQLDVSATGGNISSTDGERGIYLSCILRPSIFHSQAGLLGPMSAVALVTALEDHTSKELGIGWVSDIYCDRKKIGMSFIEGKLDNFTSFEYLIVNFSVKIDDRNFPPRLTNIIKKVFEEDNLSVGMIIAKEIINKFFGLYRELKNPNKYMDVYADKFILAGKKIKYFDNGSKKTGRVINVDKNTCALTVEAKDGEMIMITSPSGVIIPNKI